MFTTFVINSDGGIFFLNFFATVSTSGCNLFCGLEIVGEMCCLGLRYNFDFLGLSTNGLKNVSIVFSSSFLTQIFPTTLKLGANFTFPSTSLPT